MTYFNGQFHRLDKFYAGILFIGSGPGQSLSGMGWNRLDRLTTMTSDLSRSHTCFCLNCQLPKSHVFLLLKYAHLD